MLVVSGCTAPRRTYTPPVDPSSLDDATFLHYLAAAPTVTVAEGARGVLLLIGPTSNWPHEDDRTDRLRHLGAIRDEWAIEPDQTLDKGTLAYMLTVVVKTPPSVNESAAALTGLGDRRYALKTCIDVGLLPYGLPHDAVTGGELVSAIRKAENVKLR
jgi:hypothetical protein